MMETVLLFQLCFILIGVGTVRLAPVSPPHDVAAPDNLSIFCRNGKNVAYWNYSGPTAVQFFVTITSYNHGVGIFYNKTREHHINISSVMAHHEQDVYSFSLVANSGSANSSKVQTSFSYSSNYPASVPCYMDFPSPTIEAEENRIMFQFDNPLTEVYYYVENETEADYAKFQYTVYTSHDEKESTFECSEADGFSCQGEILLNTRSIENCTTLELRGEIDSIRYKTSKDFCNLVAEKGPWPILLLVVISIIVVAGLAVILLGMQKLAKAVIKSHRLPDILHPRPGSTSQRILHPEAANTSRACAGETPLLNTPEDSPPITASPQGCKEQTHFPILAPPQHSDNNNSDQPGDGYEARLGGELDSDPEPGLEPGPDPESTEDNCDDGYMQRDRISDHPDGSCSSLVMEMAPGNNCVSTD